MSHPGPPPPAPAPPGGFRLPGNHGHPPPPPHHTGPPPQQFNGPPPGNFNGPPPNGNFRPQGPPQGMPMPMQRPMEMPIRQPMPFMQNGARIPNVLPNRIMAEPTAEKQLTTFRVFTIRKNPPINPRAEPTWGDAETTQEYLDDAAIIRQIKTLDLKKETVLTKKAALKTLQTKNVDDILRSLMRSETDPRNFGWSLVQLESKLKEVPRERGFKKGAKETVTLTVYVKRAPLPDSDPVALLAEREQMKFDIEAEQRLRREDEQTARQRARAAEREEQDHRERQDRQQRMITEDRLRQQAIPPPQFHPQPFQNFQPQQNQRGPPQPHAIKFDNKRGRKNGNFRKDYHNDSDSTQSSFNDSRSGSDSDDSSRSSASSDRRKSRRYSANKVTRSHSKQRPGNKNYRDSRSPSPFLRLKDSHQKGSGHHINDFGGIPQRHFAPEVPRTAQTVPEILAAYEMGKNQGYSKGLNESDRQAAPPVVVERIIERERSPQYLPPVISYSPEARFEEPRRLKTRRVVNGRQQYVDDLFREEGYSTRRQQQDVEDYIRTSGEPREEYKRAFDQRTDRRQYSPVRTTRVDRPAYAPELRTFTRRPSVHSPIRPIFNDEYGQRLPRHHASSTTNSSESEYRDQYRGPFGERFPQGH